MTDETKGQETKGRETKDQKTKGRRWLKIALLSAIPALFLAGTAGAFWTGYRLYDEPFVWYNLNRVAATADRAARAPEAVTVVALGDSALRHATQDEEAMAKLAERHGVKGLHFLRIVHDNAQFADFEPMLDGILDMKPDVVLIDLDLLFTERRAFADLRRYGDVLTGVALDGKPYLRDQVAIQYGRPCTPANADGVDLQEIDRRIEAWREVVEVAPESPAFERVRRFADQARAGGARVALLHLRRPPALEERLYGAGNSHMPAILARLNDRPGLPLWRFPEAAHKAEHYCRDGALGPEGRKLYSAWLAGGIVQFLSEPRVEEAALQ